MTTLKRLASIALLLTASLPMLPVSQANAAPNLTAAASPWQPVARINPQKPYQVQLVNQTGIILEYSSTTNEFSPRRLSPGASTMVSQLPLPVYLLISPTNPRFNLDYTVSAKNNLVTVKVRQLPESSPGKTTVNIQETGGIFIY